MVLHVFDITPPLDEAGRPIQIEMRMENKLVSCVYTYLSSDVLGQMLSQYSLTEMFRHPMDCRCTIKPRSEQAKRLVLASVGSTGLAPYIMH